MPLDKTERNKIMRPALEVLIGSKHLWHKDLHERSDMTVSSNDADGIPRVKDAGKTRVVHGVKVQVMHNGLLVKQGGYQGAWQTRVIEALRGVHEPQEEKVFHAVIQRLKPGATIMELGSWWSYYSLWVLKDLPNSSAICCEPDPGNLELGKENALLNGYKPGEQIIFYRAAAGSQDGKIVDFHNEDGTLSQVPIRTVDSIMLERRVATLDILHLDIQGFELEALHGSIQSIKANKIRFLFVSTHHYSISGDPLLHQKCLDFISKNGGHIIAKHTILESSSGDGLIVASFYEKDKDFKVSVSLQPTDDSLFRNYEHDLDILWKAHNSLIKYAAGLEKRAGRLQAENHKKDIVIKELDNSVRELSTFRRFLNRKARSKAKAIKRKIVR